MPNQKKRTITLTESFCITRRKGEISLEVRPDDLPDSILPRLIEAGLQQTIGDADSGRATMTTEAALEAMQARLASLTAGEWRRSRGVSEQERIALTYARRYAEAAGLEFEKSDRAMMRLVSVWTDEAAERWKQFLARAKSDLEFSASLD